MTSIDWNARWITGDTPWDKGTATPVLAEIAARHPDLFHGRVLAPGCGAGHDARWLTRHGCETTGWDIAPRAVETARRLGGTFEVHDFFEPPDETFDVIFEHTCFCAIHPAQRGDYIRSAGKLLETGGRLVGVFFINPDMAPGEPGPPFGVDAEELETMWRAGGFDVVDSWVPETGFPGRLGRERVVVLEVR